MKSHLNSIVAGMLLTTASAGLAQPILQFTASAYPVADELPSLDLDGDLAGRDTFVTRYTHCPPGGAVELWTIDGGAHTPSFTSDCFPRIVDWLLAHPKP